MEGGVQGGQPVFSPAYVSWQKSRVWVVTFISYTCFHLARKIYSIVKEPIEQDLGNTLTKDDLGDLDTVFLISYALGMFFMGYIADRTNIRIFLGLCMIGSGIGCAACGLLKAADKMTFTYLAILYVITGVFQSGGWPSNVAVMGVWFGKGTRGLVMGIWNAHTSIGNILGALIATAMFTKSHYEYVQIDQNVPHGADVLIMETDPTKGITPTNKITLKAAETYCDKTAKCVAFTTETFAGSAKNASAAADHLFYFLNSTSKVKAPADSSESGFDYLDEEAADTTTCTMGSGCTFQKDVRYDISYYVLGAIIAVGGIIILLFLVPHPRDVGLPSPDEEERKARNAADPESSLNESLMGANGDESAGATVSPIQALCIPGVLEFALCFFFAKFVSYTFLFWLPYYLEAIGLPKARAGNLSTFFDVGGIVGGILCGVISDRLGKRAVVAAVFMGCAIPAMFVYRSVVTGPSVSDTTNGGLMFVAGTFINGVYALITTAVSADLGTSPTLKGNGNALAMVTAIIDGTGSLGACITGVAITRMSTAFDTCHPSPKDCTVPGSDPGGWNGVFLVLEICAGMTILMLSRLILKECKELCCAPSGPSTNLQYGGR